MNNRAHMLHDYSFALEMRAAVCVTECVAMCCNVCSVLHLS